MKEFRFVCTAKDGMCVLGDFEVTPIGFKDFCLNCKYLKIELKEVKE